MSRKRWLYLVVAVAGVVSLLASGCAAPVEEEVEEEVVEEVEEVVEEVEYFDWSLAHFGAATHPDKFNPKQWFADRVEELTDGRLKQTIYYSQILAPLRGTPELLGAGVFEIGSYGPNYAAAQLTLQTLTLTPGITPCPDARPELTTREEIIAQMNKGTEWGQYLHFHPLVQAECAKMNFVNNWVTGYSYYDNGLLLRNKKVETVEDMVGLNVRVSGLHTEMARAWGANPVGISWGDIYEGLQKGMLDVIISNYAGMKSSHFDEVTKYVALGIPVPSQCAITGVNLDAWNSLPQDIKDVWYQALEEVQPLSNAASYDEMIPDYDYAIAQGIEIYRIDPAEAQRFVEAARVVGQVWLDDCLARGKTYAKTFLSDVLDKYSELMDGKKSVMAYLVE